MTCEKREKNNKKQYLSLAIVVIVLVSCSGSQTQPESTPSSQTIGTDTPLAVIPNPASVFCQEQGYQSKTRTAEDSSQYGVCIFPDGSECDEWAYFRDECRPVSQNAILTDTPLADMSNPALVFCQKQGYQSEVRTAEDGSQYGVCIFPDGSECNEWAFYHGECSPGGQSENAAALTKIPTALPIDESLYDTWQTYLNPVYEFSIMLPEDWIVDEIAPNDPLLGGHLLNLHPQASTDQENIRMTFRRVGEETLLWPTGVGQGSFLPQGTLVVADQPAQRLLLVCPTGEVTAIWFHEADGEPNITRGDLEFGFIYSVGNHCEPGSSLNGKAQLVGEMIIASLETP